jgi:chemotaxis protein MotA
VGHGIAVAFVATVYGVGSANIFFLPASNKLRSRMRQATLMKDMIMEGIVGIVEGLNPTLIRMKLDAFNPQPARSKSPKKSPAAKVPATPQPDAAPARGSPPQEPASART